MIMNIFVTGGIGYIGSHTIVELLNNNYKVIVIDNFSNSKKEVIDKIKRITNKDFKFYYGDLGDNELVEKIFKENKIDAVIHFAGYKAVGESVEKPLKYYTNNLGITLNLCNVMNKYNVKNLIFSSSATVYGNPKKLPITEDDDTLYTTSCYAESKRMIERILKDVYNADNSWNIAILRYFNPIGAHKSGLIGEDDKFANNLMPYILKVATHEYEYLNIFGNDYNTVDGTGVRDYIHVVDLAKGHIKALEWTLHNNGFDYFNLGTGRGSSVLEIVDAFIKYNEVDIPYKFVQRRKGDIDSYYANVEKAKNILGFNVEYDIKDMVIDSYNYVKKLKK